MNTSKTSSKVIRGLIAAALSLIIFTGAVSCTAKQKSAEVKITLFHMNDFHSRIDDLAKIAYLLKEEKKKNPNVFLLNAGDNFSGNPIVDQYEPKGLPMRELLNQLGIAALTLGNHEFDYGQEILKDFMGNANFPILCANVKVSPEAGAVIPQPKAFVILKTKEGIKIALLGLIQVERKNKIPSTHPAKLKGLTFSYGVEIAKNYRHLRERCAVFIALTHLGYETDEILAGEMGEFDIIIGGHSHTLVKNPVLTNNVLITQAGAYGRYLGRVDITLSKGKIIKREAAIIPVDSIKKEIPGLKKKIAAFNKNPRLNRVIVTLPADIEEKYILGNLVTDAMRKVNHLDIGFHNNGGTRAHRMDKKIRLRDIYTLLPFGNDIVSFEMTTAEIKSLIEFDFERHYRAELFVSGISYFVKHTGEHEVKEIELRDEKGNLLDDNKTYKVGINDYIVSAYDFAHRDPGKSLQMTVAGSLIQYLKQSSDVTTGIEAVRIRTKLEAGE